jgi:hypothetical protein
MGLRIGLPLFAGAFVADLGSKAVAVHSDLPVYYHDVDGQLWRRVLMSALAVAFAAACTWIAARRGFGRPWGAWIGTPLLVAGTLGNGVSLLIWTRGVPDFIVTGDWIGNLADFEIFFGVVGGIFALIAGFCLSYARERLSSASPIQ